MTTEQEVLDDLIQAITNTNTSNDDFLKVLKGGRDQDVALRDGTVVPSLTKRVVNAFSNSDYLMKADNLASVVDKQEARDNLNVPTKEDVLTATEQATETGKGTAKIATTAIAQAGVNDTDFLTAKKLRDALNASGSAPVSACRAWLSVNTVTSTILQSFNIASFVKTTTGQFEITFTTPMPHQNYVAFTNNLLTRGGTTTNNTVGVTFNATQTNTVSRCYIWCWSTSNGSLLNPEVLNVGVFC